MCSIEHNLPFYIDLHFRLDRSLSFVPCPVVCGRRYLVFCLYLSSSRLGLYISSYRDHRCSLWSLPRTDHVVVWRWFTACLCLCDVNWSQGWSSKWKLAIYLTCQKKITVNISVKIHAPLYILYCMYLVVYIELEQCVLHLYTLSLHEFINVYISSFLLFSGG